MTMANNALLASRLATLEAQLVQVSNNRTNGENVLDNVAASPVGKMALEAVALSALIQNSKRPLAQAARQWNFGAPDIMAILGEIRSIQAQLVGVPAAAAPTPTAAPAAAPTAAEPSLADIMAEIRGVQGSIASLSQRVQDVENALTT